MARETRRPGERLSLDPETISYVDGAVVGLGRDKHIRIIFVHERTYQDESQLEKDITLRAMQGKLVVRGAGIDHDRINNEHKMIFDHQGKGMWGVYHVQDSWLVAKLERYRARNLNRFNFRRERYE